MKGNDLANEVVPRDMLVWEGLLGVLPDSKIGKTEQKYRTKEKWEDAVACYEINELLARRLWDMTWRYGLEIDLLTYLGQPFAKALEARIERENLPIRRVYADEPSRMARRLVTMIDVRTIYDPFPEHRFLYGSKGRVLTPETAHLTFGSM